MASAIDPGSDRPVFRQLADLLRGEIASGTYPPGALLPSQAQLTAQHGVSVATAREAIKELRKQGLVETVRGLGVFVRRRPAARRVSSTRYAEQLQAVQTGKPNYESGFTRDHMISWEDYAVRCSFDEAIATETVAELLGVEPGAPVFRRHMVMLARGHAEQIRTSYYPLDLVAGTAMTDPMRQPWPGGVIAELAGLGVTITATDEDVSARMPTPEEAGVLRIADGVPVLAVTRVGYAEGRAVEAVVEMIMPADRIVLHYYLDLTR